MCNTYRKIERPCEGRTGGKGGGGRGGIRAGARGSFSGRAASSRGGSLNNGHSRSTIVRSGQSGSVARGAAAVLAVASGSDSNYDNSIARDSPLDQNSPQQSNVNAQNTVYPDNNPQYPTSHIPRAGPAYGPGQNYQQGSTGSPGFGGKLETGFSDPVKNKKILALITPSYLDGFAIKKVKQFNSKLWLNKYRRNYWLGDRYYALDRDSGIQSRKKCVYRMSEEERNGLYYESDNGPITTILFQCRSIFENCCGLDCCKTDKSMYADDSPYRSYFKNSASHISAFTLIGTTLMTYFVVL